MYDVQCENDKCPEHLVPKSVPDNVATVLQPGTYINCGQCGYPTKKIEVEP